MRATYALLAVALVGRVRAELVREWCDSGFEAVPVGALTGTSVRDCWEIQRTGRDVIKDHLVVAGVADATKARSGSKFLALSIPPNTVGFEFVTVGQRVRLGAGKTYEASVWVRWPDGPEAAPANASATSGHRSAIISFWARHREGTGDFAGRDEWLFDNRWHRLSFRFRATDPAQRTLVYVSLLPNQQPAATTVLIDDFTLNELACQTEIETRSGEILADPDFLQQTPGRIAPPWYFANLGGPGISGEFGNSAGQRCFTLAMGPATSNLASAQLWQHVGLVEGVRYEVSCRIRWENFALGAAAPIVNYGIYHEESRTWYGPVDQVLAKTSDGKTYCFAHVPPFPGRWKFYVQLNGWGNFGRSVTVSVSDVSCRANTVHVDCDKERRSPIRDTGQDAR